MNRKPLTKREQEIANLQFELDTAIRAEQVRVHHDAIRVRMQSPVQSERRTVSYFVRDAKYTLPSLGMWKRWVESRVGSFMLSGKLHVLCIACGIPVAVSSGVKQRIGSRDRYTVETGVQSKVTAGAVVKWTEYEEQVWNVYNPTIPDAVDVTEKKVRRLVTVKGLGCTECQAQMLRVAKENAIQHTAKVTEHLHKFRELELAIAELRRTEPEKANAIANSLKSSLKELPTEPTDYILVDPKEIHAEQTVAYWNPAIGKVSRYDSPAKSLKRKVIVQGTDCVDCGNPIIVADSDRFGRKTCTECHSEYQYCIDLQYGIKTLYKLEAE